ncbi:MAG: hypothetical protein ACI85K_003129, partial [Hyphomicrobiaceae bacterium]
MVVHFGPLFMAIQRPVQVDQMLASRTAQLP